MTPPRALKAKARRTAASRARFALADAKHTRRAFAPDVDKRVAALAHEVWNVDGGERIVGHGDQFQAWTKSRQRLANLEDGQGAMEPPEVERARDGATKGFSRNHSFAINQ